MFKKFISLMLVVAVILTLLVPMTSSAAAAAPGDAKIRVKGTEFVVGPWDRKIWMNGVNTPWISWNEFTGTMNANAWTNWRNEFNKLHTDGVNSTRIWVNCTGQNGITITSDGYVTAVSQTFWNNMDQLFNLAEEYGVYIMATLASFDWFTNGNSGYQARRAMIQDPAKIDSYVANYVVPFIERYGDRDYLWCIDLCNEADWIHEEDRCGKLDSDYISEWVARSAVGIHKTNPDVLVTFGLAMTKYHTDTPDENEPCPFPGDYGAYEGSWVSDGKLASFIDDPTDKELAHLDFYSTHYYEWECPWFGNPFVYAPADYGDLGGRPAVIGETSASGSGYNYMYADESTNWNGVPSPGAVQLTAVEDYNYALQNGWQGVMMWTSNGVDSNGGWGVNCPTKQVVPSAQQAVNSIRDAYLYFTAPLDVKPTDIDIAQLPDIQEYEIGSSEEFVVPDGGVIDVVFETGVWSIPLGMAEISPFDATTAGCKEITATYDGASATFNVFVMARLIDLKAEASVKKLNGNKNDLTIKVTEYYNDGTVIGYEETFSISNNAADTYAVGPHMVYVDTKGNDQIRACDIVG